MIVACIELTSSDGFMCPGFVHRVLYDDLEAAWSAYREVAELLRRRSEKANDLPKLVELNALTSLSLPLESVRSVSIDDYAKQNEHWHGARDTYPHLKL